MEDEVYYVICSSAIPELPYLRIVYGYDDAAKKLTLDGYSTLGRWTDATLFNTEEEAREVMNTNRVSKNIERGELSLVRIHIKKEKL